MPTPFCARLTFRVVYLPLAAHYFPFALVVSWHHRDPLFDGLSRGHRFEITVCCLIGAVGKRRGLVQFFESSLFILLLVLMRIMIGLWC
jgi:hypothetical protein